MTVAPKTSRATPRAKKSSSGGGGGGKAPPSAAASPTGVVDSTETTTATTTTAAPTPKRKNLLAQLVPIPGLFSFTWSEYKTLYHSREAELAPSFPAFLVNTEVHDLSAMNLGCTAAGGGGGGGITLTAGADAHPRRRGFVLKTREQVQRGISPAVISTQTKIVMLSDNVDVDDLFWRLPLIRYEEPRAGILKKQIQVQSTTPEEVQAYLAKRAGIDRFFTELVTADTKNCNVNARKASFVDERIPFVGIVSKDLVNSQSKVKGTFIHCTTLNVRAWNAAADRWNEVHLKVFNTGKIILPGIVVGAIDMFLHVLALVLELLNNALQESRPGAAPLRIRHDLTASSGNHFGDPHGLLPPASSILADNRATAAEAAADRALAAAAQLAIGGHEDELDDDAAAAALRPPDASRCPEGCPGRMLVGDTGAPVCGTCGVLVPFSLDHGPDWKTGGAGDSHDARGREVPRCGNAVNPTMIETSFAYRLTPAIGGGSAMRNVAKWMSWLGGGQSEKSHGDEVQLLRRVGACAGLPRTVVATAEQLLYRLRGHPASRGLTKPMRRICYIWLACQAHGCPRTVPEMAALFRVDAHVATRSCALNFEDVVDSLETPLSGQRQLYFGPVLPGHFVHRFAHRLELHGAPVDIALYVATVVARHDVVPGNRPHAIAAAVLYYVALCCGVALTKKKTWQMLNHEISEVGIHRCATKLSYYKLFPAELRTQYPLADVVETKCLSAQRLLEASAAAVAASKNDCAQEEEEEDDMGASKGLEFLGYITL